MSEQDDRIARKLLTEIISVSSCDACPFYDDDSGVCYFGTITEEDPDAPVPEQCDLRKRRVLVELKEARK